MYPLNIMPIVVRNNVRLNKKNLPMLIKRYYFLPTNLHQCIKWQGLRKLQVGNCVCVCVYKIRKSIVLRFVLKDHPPIGWPTMEKVSTSFPLLQDRSMRIQVSQNKQLDEGGIESCSLKVKSDS